MLGGGCPHDVLGHGRVGLTRRAPLRHSATSRDQSVQRRWEEDQPAPRPASSASLPCRYGQECRRPMTSAAPGSR
eukprot:6105167-Heterocapsa_arctica.AAC.1